MIDPPGTTGDGAAPTGTRAALIDAALGLFGRRGYAATSIRELAETAGTNVASISYHFGSKEGLRLACGVEVVRRLGAVLSSVPPVTDVTPDAARMRLTAVARAMVGFLCGSHKADDLAAFMLGEMGAGGAVLDHVYETLIEPKHRELCALWAAATGQEAESEAVRLAVFAFIGQIVYFRIARPLVDRRMNWDGSTPAAASRIADRIVANLHLTLSEGAEP